VARHQRHNGISIMSAWHRRALATISVAGVKRSGRRGGNRESGIEA